MYRSMLFFSFFFIVSSFVYAESPEAEAEAEGAGEDKPELVAPVVELSSGWTVIPDEVFSPLLAGVREPFFSTRYERYKGQVSADKHFNAGSVSFGKYLPLVGYNFEDGSELQFTFDGAMFSIYNLDRPSFDQFNTDYHVALGVAYAEGPYSLRLRVHHQSSHLGDEFLLENEGFQRRNSSFEDFQLVLAYQLDGWRFYGGGDVIFRSNSIENYKPFGGRGGIEYRYEREGGHDLLAGINFQSGARMSWQLSTSIIAGMVLLKRDLTEVRIMANYYRGNSPNGQFFEERVEYYGLGFYFLV